MFDLVSKVAGNVITSGISKLVLGSEDSKASENTENVENTESTEQSNGQGFDEIIKKFLPASEDANVSEEELFAATIGQRLHELKGPEALAKYQEYLEAEKLNLTTPSGHVQVEQAAINALKQVVTEGLVTTEEGDTVYSESFAAAQLDADTTSLFDNRGDANDPSIAVAKMSEAILKIKSYLEADESTRATLNPLSLTNANQTGSAGSGVSSTIAAFSSALGTASGDNTTVNPNGTYVDGSEGFLFKPVTNNEGKLAVLFAQSWTNNIAAVRLLDQNGALVEQGLRKPEGIAETGREKFTFNKTGSSYPSNINVEVQFKDGSMKMFNIPDPSQRYD